LNPVWFVLEKDANNGSINICFLILFCADKTSLEELSSEKFGESLHSRSFQRRKAARNPCLPGRMLSMSSQRNRITRKAEIAGPTRGMFRAARNGDSNNRAAHTLVGTIIASARRCCGLRERFTHHPSEPNGDDGWDDGRSESCASPEPEEFTMRKATVSLLVIITLASTGWGCAPSVTVRQAGHARQFEVTVSSNEFSFAETQDLLNTWHQQARSTCGGDYRVVSRDILERKEPFNEMLVTGIVECH
jgi:hypothetical protein